MAITLTQAQARLDDWMAADARVATGQSYTVQTATGSRQLTRADAAEIRKNISYWESKVNSLTKKNGSKSILAKSRFYS